MLLYHAWLLGVWYGEMQGIVRQGKAYNLSGNLARHDLQGRNNHGHGMIWSLYKKENLLFVKPYGNSWIMYG